MSRVYLSYSDLIVRLNEQVAADKTGATPYFGRGHLYSSAREEITKDILYFEHARDNNHARARFLAPIFDAKLLDDLNIWRLVLADVDGSGKDVYAYMQEALENDEEIKRLALPPRKREVLAKKYADDLSRHASDHYINSAYGDLTTSVIACGRNRVFFDTEFMRIGRETTDMITGIAKNPDFESVNQGSIIQIRKLFNQQAIELAYRVVCVNEQDLLCRTAWNLGRTDIMRHCLDVEEYYMLDREKVWHVAQKEIFDNKVHASDLIKIDREIDRMDKIKNRDPLHNGTPADRFSRKQQRLFLFALETIARKTGGALIPA